MTLPAFSSLFAQPTGSPIRELFPYLSQPGIISLAGGYPSPSLFDVEGLDEACQRTMVRGGAVLQYGPTEGQPELREALGALMAGRGGVAGAGDVLVTTGSQQAFDLLLRVFLDPGDTVLIESPAYPAAIQALRLANARLITVPTDANGLDIDRLRVILAESPIHQRPKLLYTVPNFSNPGGTLLADGRRRELVALAVEYGVLIVEDDPYGELTFTGHKATTLYQYGAEWQASDNPVVYLSSLSKTVAPALRTGWLVARPDVLRRCAIAKQTVDLCTSALTQAIAAEYLRLGRYEERVSLAAAEYSRRMQTLTEALSETLTDRVRFVTPEGGMFLWVDIVSPIDSAVLFQAAVRANVLYVPGTAFDPEGKGLQAMRLSFAGPDMPQIQEAVVRLGQAFAEAETAGIQTKSVPAHHQH
ncbi:PLP-dependent aminotransferase family protein [Lampropedia puyangensis]|uniref:PLP-dependent aminotransferase family protein n=1 Tax=Lampropedia puyangensis TaxID=1330072 RepID=A0A4S8FCZ2_9BURK|nr:PLP-dependent aminotransferase family protein [Lampropedia puyangensis]THU05217.1 PLP-dependent aminotransferase family protein [Lampropedia puyangensis]